MPSQDVSPFILIEKRNIGSCWAASENPLQGMGGLHSTGEDTTDTADTEGGKIACLSLLLYPL